MTKHRVLIPLDGSEFSRQILHQVREFLSPADTELILMRVAEPPKGISGAPAKPATFEVHVPMYESERDAERAKHPIYADQERDSAQAAIAGELQADVQRMQDAGYTVSAAIRFGDPAPEIVKFTAREPIDLIAMTTHGRTGLSRLLFGSVAERVLRNVAVPVMLMRPFEKPARTDVPGNVLAQRLTGEQPVRIAVATDGSPFAQTATAVAGELARALESAEVTLLAAVHEDVGAIRAQEILDEARDLLGDVEPAPQSVPLIGYADEEIIHHLAEQPADLLIIGAFGDRGASRFFIGSTAHRLAMYAPTSVLIVKDQRMALDKILVCTDVGDDPVVEVGAQLGKTIGADLRLLHVIAPSAAMYLALPDVVDVPLDEVLQKETPLAQHLSACVAKLEAAGFDDSNVKVHRGPLPDALFEEARGDASDLIVVGSQAGAARDRYWIGSIADRVVKHAHRSVLVVRTT